MNKKEKTIEEMLAPSSGKIRVKQIGSSIGCSSNQRKNLCGLGLNRINKVRVLDNNPTIMGMVNKVKHLIKIENV